MKRPLNSSMEAYKIMKDCWNNDPLHRPTFSDLVKDFEHLLTIAKECNYLQMSETFERTLADKGGKYGFQQKQRIFVFGFLEIFCFFAKN